MDEQPEIVVTVQGVGEYTDGRYRAIEVEHDNSDPDNPALRVWLDPERPKESR